MDEVQGIEEHDMTMECANWGQVHDETSVPESSSSSTESLLV